MSKEALVVDRKILFSDGYFHGFIAESVKSYIDRILSSYKYHLRGDELETNKNLQQIIPYVWIVNPKTKKIFVYRRADNKNYTEKRLRNKWSCGVGGHIDKEDSENPITNAMMRELKEEIKISEYPSPQIIGYINLDSSPVDEVHFGVVAIAETTQGIEKGNDEMVECKMCTIPELQDIFSDPNNDVEDWTRISWPYIKEYLLSRN